MATNKTTPVKLTARQQQILDLIKQHIIETGFPPTRSEIALEFGFKSPNAAEEHLRALARKGAIEMVSSVSRGIRLVEPIEPGLPLVGRVAAGDPILATENIEDHIEIASNFFHPSADYLLRVQGMSMKDIGILDGDLLAVHRTTDVHNGQVVVARVDEDVTVKRLEKKGRQVLLHAENADFSPIEVDLATQPFNIEGIAVGVIRNADWM